jgi:hypothetical protein
VAPVANAGTAQNVLVGTTVALSGAVSSDANGDSLTYLWSFTSKPVGSTSILSNTSSVNPSFVPNIAGSYVLNLIVNDGRVSSAASTVTIAAAAANVAPVSNAGTAQNAVVDSTVALSGGASSDANGDTLAYTWGFTSKPSGSTATLSNVAIVSPTFVPDLAGSYVLNLVVSDGQLSSTVSTVTITASVASGVISASVSASRISGVAPLSVFFDASGTTSSGTSKPFHDLEYRWNFGDTSSGTWNVGSRTGASRNVARGPMASHVFETPGVYTVTMVATDGTNAPVNTVQITVSDPNTIFAANTICFSTSGTFTGCPAGAAQQTISDFAAAINSNQGTKKRLLFRRGETWTSAAAARISTNGPGIVGAFGSGASPKWIIATNNAALYLSYQSTAGIKDWRVMDIEMDGQNRFTAGVNGDGGIDQVLLSRLNIHNVSNGIVMSASVLDYENTDGNPAHGGHTVWDQFAVIDTRVNTINGGIPASGYIGAYISATRFTFMGNDFDSVNGGGHVLRTPYVGRGVVSNNYFARPHPDKHLWQFHAPGQSQTGVTGGGRSTEKVMVSDNTFFGGSAVWAVFMGPQNTSVDERIQNVIFERNYFIAGSGTNVALEMRGPVSLITVRNNIANLSAPGTSGINGFETGDGGIGPVPTNISYYNNTIYGTGTGQFNGIALGNAPTNITVKNNLAYAPNASAVNLLIGSGSSGLNASNNTANASIRTSPGFATIPSGNSLISSDFKIGSGSYAAVSGAATPVLSDFFQTNTSLIAPDIGAVVH